MYAHTMQNASSDCGIATIQTILKQFRIKSERINLNKVISKSFEQGLSISNIQEILEDYGIISEAYEVSDIEKLSEQIFPMILMCRNEGLPHYVVLHQVKDSNYVISDPANPQLTKLSKENLLECFMGYAICVEEVKKVKNKKYQVKFLYDEIIGSLNIVNKLKIVFVAIIKYVCPLSLVFFIQYVMVYQMENMSMFNFFAVCLFFLSLMIGYFYINQADMKIKTEVENKFQKKVLHDFYKLKVSELSNKKDINNIMGYFWNLLISVTGVLQKFYLKVDILFVLLLCIVLSRINLFLAISVFIWSILFVLIIQNKVGEIRNYERNLVYSSNGLSSTIEEQVLLSLDIHMFSKNEDAEKRLFQKMEDYFIGKKKSNEIMAYIDSVFEIISACVLLTVFGLFIYSYVYGANQSMTALMLSIFIISIILARLKPVAQTWIKYQKSAIAVEYIQNDNVSPNNSKLEEKESLKLDKISQIIVKDLVFSYDDGKCILNNFEAEFMSGQIVGITGSNGSGKSTLIKILMGILSPNKGNIKLNNNNYEDLSDKNIEKYISTYLPEMDLFQNTLGNNISFNFKNKKTQYNIDIENIKEGFNLPFSNDYVVFSRGNNLSKGQVQKLLLMRCLNQEKDIYIFDEPTSNLDKDSSDYFKMIIDKLRGMGRIVIIVSHDKSILKQCTQIYDLG